MLELDGSMVVADALNCQKETASSIRQAGGDYLLSVKDNQPTLKEEIESYAQTSELQKGMGTFTTVEKNRGRIEERTAYITDRVNWLDMLGEWEGLATVEPYIEKPRKTGR